jgi:hypothetical protein
MRAQFSPLDQPLNPITPAPVVVSLPRGVPARGLQAATAPLTMPAAQLASIESVGQRLHGELARFLKWLPAEHRSVRTMAALLNIDRNTCQRVLTAAQPGIGGAEVFLRLPGVRPLRDLVARARAAGAPAELTDALAAAVERLAQLADELGESQARLKARVTGALTAGAYQHDRGEMDVRRALFDEHARMLGRRVRINSLITAIGPHDSEQHIEQAWVRALVGVSLQPGATALSLGIASTDRTRDHAGPSATFNPLGQRAGKGQRASALVPQLSSSPLPTLTTRGPSGSQVFVLDPAAAGAEPVDATIATRISHVTHPRLQTPEVFHTSTVMLIPAERLVFDVYLHRSLARASVPACGVFQYTMSFSDDMDENWPFRLPIACRQVLLGSGLANAASEAWDGHARAAAHLFDHTGWPANEYVGHRVELTYSPWGSSVFQWFDFRDSAQA